MNLSLGLQRISTVLWALVALAFGLLLFDGGHNPQYGVIVIVAVVSYSLHWLTCWIIRGFFGDGK